MDYSANIETDFVILALSSGGLRVGAWNELKWENIFPIYQINGEYKIDLEKGEAANIVCAGMIIYKGTTEEYTALISLEAWEKLQEYKKIWTKKMSRPPIESNYLILERFSKPVSITERAVKYRIEKLLLESGLRTPLTEGKRRHNIPATHGFRRFWDKVMMQTKRSKGTL